MNSPKVSSICQTVRALRPAGLYWRFVTSKVSLAIPSSLRPLKFVPCFVCGDCPSACVNIFGLLGQLCASLTASPSAKYLSVLVSMKIYSWLVVGLHAPRRSTSPPLTAHFSQPGQSDQVAVTY